MTTALNNIRIARVSTIPFFVFTQLRDQLDALAAAGAEVSVITSDDELTNTLHTLKSCRFQPVYIAREINLWLDLMALVKLWRLFRKERFQLVHSTTPKAGLLCALAAKLAGTPVCIHTFTGQAWVTMTGLKKKVVQWSDKLIARLNRVSYTDSVSQRDFLIKNKITTLDKIKVIGSGSLAGVDVVRFSLKHFSSEDKQQLKISLQLDNAAKVLLFVGRVTREKGIYELFEALQQVRQKGLNVALIVVGPFEQHNEAVIRELAQASGGDNIHFVGFQTAPEQYIAIADVLCLPSYREGFGTVVIEAAAMKVPVVGTSIYGLSDAVVDGVTGVLVEPRNSAQLAQAIERLVVDEAFRLQLGEQAYQRALAEYDSREFNKLMVQEYNKLLENT